MKVAIVHDYLFQYGGGEKVVEKWLEMYPQADLYTSFCVASQFISSPEISKAIKDNRIKATWLQRFFGSSKTESQAKSPLQKYHKHFFWLYPFVMSFVKVHDYDLVIISSSYCGKNVRLENCGQIIHYCHSPTRFLHNLVTETDHKTIHPVLRFFIPALRLLLRPLDLKAAKYLTQQGTQWIANSQYIRQTIFEVYQAESKIIYPPVEIEDFLHLQKEVEQAQPYYYYFGRISFHKRLDLAIRACLELERKLIITGMAAYAGEMNKLYEIVQSYEKQHPQAKGLVTFVGRSSNQERNELLSGARAFLFPGKEDFGIAPIEALASGTPLIAYQAGGALEYVQEGVNGVFFDQQTVESLKQAILKFEGQTDWNTDKIRQSTKNFDEKAFMSKFQQVAGF